MLGISGPRDDAYDNSIMDISLHRQLEMHQQHAEDLLSTTLTAPTSPQKMIGQYPKVAAEAVDLEAGQMDVDVSGHGTGLDPK